MKRSTLLLLALLLCMAPLRAVLAAEEAAAANGFWDTLTRINDAVNGVVWGWPAILLLAFVGMLMTVLTRVFQVTHFRHWMKRTLGAMKDRGVMGHTADRSISQFQSLCTALGHGQHRGRGRRHPGGRSRRGILDVGHRLLRHDDQLLRKRTGHLLSPQEQRRRVVRRRHSFGIGNMTQVNAISGNMQASFGIPTWVTGIFIMVMVGLVVVGGLKRIAAVTEKIVPFMVIAYMIGSLVIFITNIDKIGAVFSAIFKGAFAAKAAGGGVVGYGMKLAIEQGCKRGVFSNEAGLGSSVMVHSNSNVKEPVMQGMWGIFEVFADTIIVCTMTAFTALSSGLIDLETGHLVTAAYNGVELTKTNLISTAFAMQFGRIGSVFIAISIMLFAFSTVLGWSHYGTKAAEYLLGEKRTFLYRILFVLLVFGGAVMGDNLAWDLADTFNGLMMIPNLIGVITLSGVVVRITKNYLDRQLRGADIPPFYSAFPDVQSEQEKG